MDSLYLAIMSTVLLTLLLVAHITSSKIVSFYHLNKRYIFCTLETRDDKVEAWVLDTNYYSILFSVVNSKPSYIIRVCLPDGSITSYDILRIIPVNKNFQYFIKAIVNSPLGVRFGDI